MFLLKLIFIFQMMISTLKVKMHTMSLDDPLKTAFF